MGLHSAAEAIYHEGVPINKPQPVQMLDFSRQFAGIREEMLDCHRGRSAPRNASFSGRRLPAFEQAAATACAVPHAVGCASGTDALWLAMAAAEHRPRRRGYHHSFQLLRDRQLDSSLRRAATARRYRSGHLQPLRRVCRGGYSKPQRARTSRPSFPSISTASAPTGTPLAHLKQRHNLLLIEDAAQAFGATWRGTPAGALGDLAAFSFYPTKNLSAFGDAGLLTTLSAEIDEHARMLRAHGMRRRYYHDEVGWNSRLDSLRPPCSR